MPSPSAHSAARLQQAHVAQLLLVHQGEELVLGQPRAHLALQRLAAGARIHHAGDGDVPHRAARLPAVATRRSITKPGLTPVPSTATPAFCAARVELLGQLRILEEGERQLLAGGHHRHAPPHRLQQLLHHLREPRARRVSSTTPAAARRAPASSGQP